MTADPTQILIAFLCMAIPYLVIKYWRRNEKAHPYKQARKNGGLTQ